MKQHWVILAVGFAFMLVQNYSYMKVPKYMRIILDEIDGANRAGVIRTNILYILLFTAVMAVSLFLMRKLIIGVSRKIEYQLRRQIYHKILSMDYLFFQQNETGDLMSRCTNDLNHARTLLGPGVMYIPNSLSRLVMFLPVLIGLSGSLMLILGLIMVVLVVFIVVLLPLLRPLFLQIQEAMGEMNNRVWQVISGISTIKQYTAEKMEIDRFKTLNEEYIKKQMAVVKLQELLRPLFFFVFSITELVILWVGGKQVINGTMTMGELLQFNVMISYLTFPILALGWMMSLIQQGISALGRINYILHHPVEDGDKKKALHTNEPRYHIDNLTYRYPGHDKEVLKGINLTIEPGQTIGITGPVGSGKSTLLNILTGLLKPEPGQVSINGTDIGDIDPRSLYSHMAVVAQEPFLFSRTVAENIALGPLDPEEISTEAIEKAAENAGLSKDIDAFHEGIDQVVGERGITLSGGQKQRVAIARALIKCAPVLVLDDPLSNIDARTEARILENLQSIHCFQTLIVVSHRISVLKTTDMIYVLEDGAIAQQGKHNRLIHKKGLYARLAKLQQMEMELEER
ncbi:MAG: ABC transporter ATP-binding protein [bacterium]|nr:ABC transporter ATP-binding protein [bacterium]